MLLSGIISLVAGLAELVHALPGPPEPPVLGVPKLSSDYPRRLPLDIQPRQAVVQIPPSVNKNDFTCPETTDKKLKLEHLQIAMNDFTYIFYTKKDVKKAFERYVAKEYVSSVAMSGRQSLTVCHAGATQSTDWRWPHAGYRGFDSAYRKCYDQD